MIAPVTKRRTAVSAAPMPDESGSGFIETFRTKESYNRRGVIRNHKPGDVFCTGRK